MILIPDSDTAFIDPFRTRRTLAINAFVHDPLTGESYSRDPRYVVRKAAEHLQSTGLADTCYVGPEAEFFIFDDVRFHQDANSASYHVDSVEGAWNTAREENPNLGYKIRYKEGYFPPPATDPIQDLRTEMIRPRGGRHEVALQHHEGAPPGTEIDVLFD